MPMIPLRDFRAQALSNCSDFASLCWIQDKIPGLLSIGEVHAINSAIPEWVSAPPIGVHFTEPYPWDGSIEKVDFEYEAVSHSMRHCAMRDAIMGQPKSILDIGANFGAHAVSLSNHYGPDTKVHIREAWGQLERAIQLTIERHAKHPECVTYSMGDHRQPALPDGFDCIYAGEVLEHQPDPYGFLDALEASAIDGAQVVVSTPVGPWELQQPIQIHLMQWEPNDFGDIAGHRGDFAIGIIYVPPFLGGDGADFSLYSATRPWRVGQAGCVVARWRVEKDKPMGEVNWVRKLGEWGFEILGRE